MECLLDAAALTSQQENRSIARCTLRSQRVTHLGWKSCDRKVDYEACFGSVAELSFALGCRRRLEALQLEGKRPPSVQSTKLCPEY